MALTDKLTAIADAIREKTGKSDAMTLEQMPAEIAEISGGGKYEVKKVVNIAMAVSVMAEEYVE